MDWGVALWGIARDRARRGRAAEVSWCSTSPVVRRTPATPATLSLQRASKKSPLRFSGIFPKRLGNFVQILHACYMFLSTLEYKFLFNYLQLQLWRSYAILSATTQFTSYVQNVHHRPKRALAFSDIFPNSWEFLVRISHVYYTFLYTLDYKFLFNYLQLWRSYVILSATT